MYKKNQSLMSVPLVKDEQNQDTIKATNIVNVR